MPVLFAVLAAATGTSRSFNAAWRHLAAMAPHISVFRPAHCLAVYLYGLGATGEGCEPSFYFLGMINIAALTQVIFTISSFSAFQSPPAAAVAFSKIQVLQTAIFEALILAL